MKKTVLNVIFLLAASLIATGQVPYQDALRLKELPVNSDSTYLLFPLVEQSNIRAAEILKNYTDKTTYGEIQQEFSDNPFIRLPPNNALSSSSVAGTKSILSGLGGLNVTSVADGIARFLVERTKAELDIYFFEQFRNFLEHDDYAMDLKVLFPNTHAMMLLAGKEIYDYQKYLQAFREAFAQDLSSLLINSHTWVNQPPPATALAGSIQKSKFYPYLNLALQVAVDVQEGKHPGDMMKDLAARDYADTTWGEFGSILKASNIISQSLRASDPERYWITQDEFTAFRDADFTKIYLGLLYQQFKTSAIKIRGRQVTETLKKFAIRIKDAQDAIDNLRPVFAEIEQVLKQLQNTTEEGNAANYLVLSNSFMNIMSTSNAGLIASGETFLPNSRTTDIEFLLTHAFNLVADVRTKSYSAAVIELSLILEKMSVKEEFVVGIIKYGSFMANVATARTAEEVQQAIEVVALPPGSYRVKRESAVNVSLNGYVGFYGGNEYMAASEKRNSFSAGLFAPVGFAFSRGKIGSSEKKGGKSLTFFASVLDLGALASFRFNDDQTNVASDIHFEDIFAPGGFFIWGFGKAPICFGAGVQMGPSLREVDPTGNPDINKDYYVRTSAFLVVDIPFLNLYNRKDKKK